jgi:hypothetical protein
MTIAVIEEGAAPSVSAITWPAVAAGGLAAIATTLILFSLGSGLGFAAASPWGDVARTAGKLGIAAAIWLVVVQWIASAAGGYLSGRLRTRWYNVHAHETFFRDTVHGFLAWALASIVIAVVAAGLAATASSGGAAASAVVPAANFAYDADTLYRTPAGDENALAPAKAEAVRLLTAGALTGGLNAADHDYLVASMAARLAVAPAEATQRVDTVLARERQAAVDAKVAADNARKAVATLGFLTALTMLVGAFIASLAGALGGFERDKHA